MPFLEDLNRKGDFMIYKLSIKYSNSNVVRHYYFDSKFGVARFVFLAINKKEIDFIKVGQVL